MWSRREWLGAATATAAAAQAANQEITFGVIATGGRGRYLQERFQRMGARCVAICDIYSPNLDKAAAISPEARRFTKYQELLGQKMDCVVIASPDHQHWPMLQAALAAKKDVYLEKPLSKSLEQSKIMVDAVRASKQVVQVGMQRRSAPALIEAKRLMDAGMLGQVTLVKPQWHWNIAKELNNGPLPGELDWRAFLGEAPVRELEPMRFRNWRYFYDYAGGNMTDQGTHLMDVTQWFTGQTAPVAAQASGYVAKMKGAEHPDVFSAIFEFPKMLVTWTLDYANSYQNGWSITFLGDEATMVLDDAGYAVYKEPWKRDAAPVKQAQAPVPMEPHIQNFFDCIKTRQDPNCTVEIAAAAVAGPHMANLAMISGNKFTRQR
jgi:predicted dehydrogenase